MPAVLVRPDTREAILDATDRLLARLGYQKMTVDDIAREAGISKRTIYLHFPSKEEVALSSIDRVVRRLLDRLEAIAFDRREPPGKLREMLITRVLFRFDSVRDYYHSLDDLFAVLRPAYMARRQGYFEQEARVFAGVLDEGCHDGVLAVTDPMETAHTLLLATNSMLPSNLSVRELGARVDVEKRIARVADLLLRGLLSRTRTLK